MRKQPRVTAAPVQREPWQISRLDQNEVQQEIGKALDALDALIEQATENRDRLRVLMPDPHGSHQWPVTGLDRGYWITGYAVNAERHMALAFERARQAGRAADLAK